MKLHVRGFPARHMVTNLLGGHRVREADEDVCERQNQTLLIFYSLVSTVPDNIHVCVASFPDHLHVKHTKAKVNV